MSSDVEQVLLHQLNADVAENLGVVLVLMSVFLVVGVFGNVTVLSVCLSDFKESRRKGHVLIFVTVDLLATLMSSTFFITISQMYMTYPSAILCKFFYTMLFFFITISGLFVVVMAVDKYFKVCRPLRSNILRERKPYVAGAIILIALLCSTPQLKIAGLVQIETVFHGRNVSGPFCFHAFGDQDILGIVHLSAVAIVFTSILTSSSVLYLCIGKTIYQKLIRKKTRSETVNHRTLGNSNIKLEAAKPEGDPSSTETGTRLTVYDYESPVQNPPVRTASSWRKLKVLRSKHNFNAMFIVMYFVYIISYIPPMMMFTLGWFDHSYYMDVTSSSLPSVVVCTSLFTVSHVTNPYIYAFFDMTFRKRLKQKCVMSRLALVDYIQKKFSCRNPSQG